METKTNREGGSPMNPAVFPHYVTRCIIGFLVVGPRLVEDARFDTEDEAFEEAAKRLAGHETSRVRIHRIWTHLEVIR